MEYLVMECGLSYAVVMDAEGRFLKVPNLGYTVGQRLDEVLLLPESPAVKMSLSKQIIRWGAMAACLCLLMLGNMLMGRADTSTAPAAPEEGDAMEFHITEDDIASVMTEALPFPVEGTAVKISRDGTIAVTAAVTRQALTESNLVPGKLRTALLFLPERCKLYAAVSNGKLSLACRTIKLEGFTLPEQTAQALSDAFAAQWNTRMEQRDFTPQTIQWQDGEAVLLG